MVSLVIAFMVSLFVSGAIIRLSLRRWPSNGQRTFAALACRKCAQRCTASNSLARCSRSATSGRVFTMGSPAAVHGHAQCAQRRCLPCRAAWRRYRPAGSVLARSPWWPGPAGAAWGGASLSTSRSTSPPRAASSSLEPNNITRASAPNCWRTQCRIVWVWVALRRMAPVVLSQAATRSNEKLLSSARAVACSSVTSIAPSSVDAGAEVL